MKSRNVMSLFGHVSIPRAYCRHCKSDSIILSARYACCDEPYVDTPDHWKRETQDNPNRVLPPIAERRLQLAKQMGRCIYCDTEFGATMYRGYRKMRARLNWDHFLPFSFANDPTARNFVAACSVCNGIKSNKMFKTLAEAKAYVENERDRLGYWVP